MLLPDLPPPVEGIRHQSNQVDAYIGQRCLGKGTLFIAESRLCWTKENSEERFALEYPHIAVHAVSRDSSNFQHPCIYLMLDICLEDNRGPNDASSDDDEEDEGTSDMTEVRFVPSDDSLLDLMYKSLNECQVLHPDPEQQESDDGLGDEEEGDYYLHGDNPNPEGYEENMEDDLEQIPTNGHNGNGVASDHDEDDMETGQFEDADM